MAIHTMAASFDDSEAFDKTVSDLIKRHKDRHVDPALWNVRYLESLLITSTLSKGIK